MTTTNTFGSTKKFNAIRSMTSAMRKTHGPEFEPKRDVDYTLEMKGDVFVATIIDRVKAPAAVAPEPVKAPVIETNNGETGYWTQTDDGPVWTCLGPASVTAAPSLAKPATATAKGGKRAAAIDAAARGELPPAPDFSAQTHAAFRKRLEAVSAMVAAGDVDGLRADTTEPRSSSRVILCRYRDLATVALEARAADAVRWRQGLTSASTRREDEPVLA